MFTVPSTMPPVSRTIGPLHFEDLEPHRFEDMVRQLAYAFRRWRLLEPTGRLGADEGVDIRAIELLRDTEEVPIADPAELGDGEETPSETVEREWVIQCKRERTIAPGRIRGIAEAALRGRPVHGFILAAACDFSRRAREVFRREAAALGAQEFYLWGKGDLEDMLFRPENDHLLFAYFGVSLVVRRRSVRTAVRAILAMKRKAVRALGTVAGDHSTEVLVRDAEDTNYPGRGQGRTSARWRVLVFLGHEPQGLRIEVRRYAAFLAENDEQWDAAFAVSQYTAHRELWLSADEEADRRRKWDSILETWQGFPEGNRAWVVVEGVLRYERIVDIDTDGDNVVPSTPHIFIDETRPGAWEPFYWKYIRPAWRPWGKTARCVAEKRVAMFPAEYRDPPDVGPEPEPDENPA
jgi:hypothetical protein